MIHIIFLHLKPFSAHLCPADGDTMTISVFQGFSGFPLICHQKVSYSMQFPNAQTIILKDNKDKWSRGYGPFQRILGQLNCIGFTEVFTKLTLPFILMQ